MYMLGFGNVSHQLSQLKIACITIMGFLTPHYLHLMVSTCFPFRKVYVQVRLPLMFINGLASIKFIE